MATINLRQPWEEEDSSSPPDVEQTEEALEEEEEELNDTDVDADPPEEPKAEEVEPEPKKEQRLTRHIAPIHPDFAEELWGQPLTDEQRNQLQEDWQLGFRQLTKAEREWYGISDDPESYASMEALSKHYLKVAATQGKDDLIALETGVGEDGWPEGYLRDKNGRFTDRCVYELLNMRDYTREYILPKEPDGSFDPKKYKRGDLSSKRKVRVVNEKYGQRFDYWEAMRDRARHWRFWKEERDRSIPIVMEVNGEVTFGELITTPSTQAQTEHDISSALQKIEQAERLLHSIPEQLKGPMWDSLKPQFTKLGLELRSQGLAHVYNVAVKGQEVESDESTESNEPRTDSQD